jgi:hypothetical protein
LGSLSCRHDTTFSTVATHEPNSLFPLSNRSLD